jgi:uncharacterized spore protein YtfJ
LYDPISEMDCLKLRVNDLKKNLLDINENCKNNEDIVNSTLEIINKIKGFSNHNQNANAINFLDVLKENRDIMA